MIFITSAANDADLRKALGSEAVEAPISFGDVLIRGVNEHGPIAVVGERKKARDMMQCINNGRHIKQVRDAYEAKLGRYFLIIEAIMRMGKEGDVEYRMGAGWERDPMPWTRFQAYLHALTYQMGVYVLFSSSVRGTAETIRGLHRYFSEVDHQSLKQFYAPVPSLLSNPSLIRRVAKELPNIGWDRSMAVERHFPSVRAMVNAPTGEWEQIEGIGTGISKRIVEVLE